ncbi:chain-length determining protein [Brevundimonas diminuta ATCC 11568]
MTESHLKYVSALQTDGAAKPVAEAWWRRLPLGFLLIVVVPTVVAMVYYLVIASPIYVSEARFVVRSPTQKQPSGIGMALQGVGIQSAANDSFAVHEYMTSRDGLDHVQKSVDVRSKIGSPNADFLMRYPRLGEDESAEGLYKGFQRFVTVGYESSTGISTLRVKAFSGRDAQAVANALLSGGEGLVNRLNERAAKDTVQYAERAEEEARVDLDEVQQRLTVFRNSRGYVDPEMSARESSVVTSELLGAVARLKAERDQIQSEAPQSPQLAGLNGRITALERQLSAERARMAGAAGSLASSVGDYRQLLLEQEIADKRLGQATAALISARDDARRQNLYLERIVNPNVADRPILPRRWFGIFSVLLSTLLIYSLGWLVYAGIREHKQF